MTVDTLKKDLENYLYNSLARLLYKSIQVLRRKINPTKIPPNIEKFI